MSHQIQKPIVRLLQSEERLFAWPYIFYEEMDALSSFSEPPVANDAVSSQKGNYMKFGELSQQNRESTEVGQGTTKDNIARDEKDYRVPGKEGRGVDLPVPCPNILGKTFCSDGQRIGKYT